MLNKDQLDQLDKLVNAKTISNLRVDVAKNGFIVRVGLRSGNTLEFVFAQPRQVSEFVQERLSKLPD